jgi:hypothetical protein
MRRHKAATFVLAVSVSALLAIASTVSSARTLCSTGGWPTFTFCVKVGAHAAGAGILTLASPH